MRICDNKIDDLHVFAEMRILILLQFSFFFSPSLFQTTILFQKLVLPATWKQSSANEKLFYVDAYRIHCMKCQTSRVMPTIAYERRVFCCCCCCNKKYYRCLRKSLPGFGKENGLSIPYAILVSCHHFPKCSRFNVMRKTKKYEQMTSHSKNIRPETICLAILIWYN